jgi:2-(1,2-epoxy-1,2-dihydrophenyl)acetyl-CoA isomerase
MSFQFIEFGIDENTAIIKLSREDVLNSFNAQMAKELQIALDTASADENVRAVYLSAKGKAFCAGQDLQEATSDDFDFRKTVKENYNPIILKIRNMEKPVVCGVNGTAAGAGANIALACDIVFSAKSAKFVQAFSSIGLIPDSGGTYVLPRLIGMQRATALTMLAEKLTADEAERIGMIWKAVDDEDLDTQALSIAKKLAKMPTKGLAYTKKLLNLSYENSLDSQLALEEEYQTMAGDTEDYKEGVNAFLEKRKPVFKGK